METNMNKLAAIVPFYPDSQDRIYNKNRFKKEMQSDICDIFFVDFDIANGVTRSAAFNKGVEVAVANGYKYIGLFDIDVLISKQAVQETIYTLASGKADVVYPFSGIPIETKDVEQKFQPYTLNAGLLDFFFGETVNFDMPYEWDTPEMLGLVVCITAESYKEVGGENPNFIGWGFEDHERYERYKKLDKTIVRLNHTVTHMSHDQAVRNNISWKHNFWELCKIQSMTQHELKAYISTWY